MTITILIVCKDDVSKLNVSNNNLGLLWWLSGKESTSQCRRCKFNPWVGEDTLEKEMATHSSILAGKSHGQRNLVSYDPWVCKRIGHDLATKQQ